MYRNSEYYPDPTAGAALRQLYRKEKDLNTGKQFEADWKKSMPPDAWCYRLKDSAASYYGGIEVEQHQLRVHWRYDVDGLLRKLEEMEDNA